MGALMKEVEEEIAVVARADPVGDNGEETKSSSKRAEDAAAAVRELDQAYNSDVARLQDELQSRRKLKEEELKAKLASRRKSRATGASKDALATAHRTMAEEIAAKEAELIRFKNQLELQQAQMEQMQVEAAHAAAERHREAEVRDLARRQQEEEEKRRLVELEAKMAKEALAAHSKQQSIIAEMKVAVKEEHKDNVKAIDQKEAIVAIQMEQHRQLEDRLHAGTRAS